MGNRQQLRADLKRWVPPSYSEELGRAFGLMQCQGTLPKKYCRILYKNTYSELHTAWLQAKTVGAKYQIRELFKRALILAVSMRARS